MGLASKLAAAQQAGHAATPGYGAGQGANPYGAPPPQQQQHHAQGAFPGQPPSSTGYGQGGYGGAPQQQQNQYAPPASSPYGAPQQQAQGQYGAPPPVPGGRPGQAPGQLPYPGAPQQGQYGQQGGFGAPQQQQYAQGQYGQGGYGYGAPPPPQGQYGAPPPQHGNFGGAPPAQGGPASNPQTILQVLSDCVRDQHIQAFYPPGSLEQIAQRVAQTGALAKIAGEWRLPMEVAMDLVKLALFDVVLYVDDSGSMAFEENGSRIDDAKVLVSKVAQAASLFDDDGIQVFFMNSRTVGNGIKHESQVQQLMSQIKFSGLTPLGTALDQKILQPLLIGPARSNALRKPLLVVAVTDGAPGGEDRHTIVRVIKNARDQLQQTRYGADALSVQLAQIGNDMGARKFLEEIDNDPVVGGLVDCTSNYADDFMKTSGQELSPELWLVKLMLGPIDSSYDFKDERR
ncbi:hypothetical protein JCM8097_002844 [Rhodosporidiobolus ruineniae]